jgi:hypothetical protein
MERKYHLAGFLSVSLAAVTQFATDLSAQDTLAAERQYVNSSLDQLWITVAFVVAICLVIAVTIWWFSRSKKYEPNLSFENSHQNTVAISYSGEESVDADAEFEWLRQAKQPKIATKKAAAAARKAKREDEATLDTKIFQEKMRRMQYSQLPINSFSQLAPAKNFEPLPVSDDPALLNAIEQANDEYEEDESVRELALRILTAFRASNSVDALSQIALYDLSSNLRSKAVNTLTEFDHESTFETILLACADPTREVRAAAARGLFRLSFDRAHAWKRIIATGDEFRMRQAARAAVEADIVEKSLTRLIHEDVKIAYEAFALVSLLIKAGETAVVFDALATHRDERVRFAMLHILRVHKDPGTIDEIRRLGSLHTNSKDLAEKFRETVKSLEKAVVVEQRL